MRALRAGTFALAVTVTGGAWAEGTTRPAERQQSLVHAAQALSRGDASAALLAYEVAASQEHAVDIETGIVQGLMGTGQYRRALAFAAHTAGAHGADLRGASLYARLLDLGGQPSAARRVREAAAARVPQAGTFAMPGTDAAEVYAPLKAGERVLGAAVIVDDGRHAVLVARGLEDVTRLAVRDGLGRRSVARPVDSDDQLGLTLVELVPPMDGVPPLSLPARAPFAGSPAYSVSPSCIADVPLCAPWPRLRLHFVGTAGDVGVDAASESIGGPLFDSGGAWLGLLVPDHSGRRLLHSTHIAQRFALAIATAAAPLAVPGPRSVPLDAIYEVSLRVSLQTLSSAPEARRPLP